MKKTLLIFILISVSVFGAPSDPVYFPDANLKAAIEDELGITDPNEADMLGLIELDANNRNISNLKGIGYAINLTRLYLFVNQINSIPNEIGNLTNPLFL